jgi:GNAT superfamily N-acetyltransferase
VSSHPLVIRDATRHDVDAEARVFNLANRPWATSIEQHRHQRSNDGIPPNGVRVVAEEGGTIVGVARSNEALEGLLPQPGMFSARVAVVPHAAGRGVGRHLWANLAHWINARQPRQVISWADRDDSRSLEVAEHWGFTRRPGTIETPQELGNAEAWPWRYELRLDTLELDSIHHHTALPADVEVHGLAEVVEDEELLASLHEAHEECRTDVPSWEAYHPMTKPDFEKAQRQRVADGGIGLVAHRRDQVLAATFAERLAFVPDLHSDFTMVRRSARGRRLAMTLKSHLITRAAALGVERITTEVRSDNTPMLVINRALGFHRLAMRHLISKDSAGLHRVP